MESNYEDNYNDLYTSILPFSRNEQSLMTVVDFQDLYDQWTPSSPSEYRMEDIFLENSQEALIIHDTTPAIMDPLNYADEYMNMGMNDTITHSTPSPPLPSSGPILPLDINTLLIDDANQSGDCHSDTISITEQNDENEVHGEVFEDRMNYIMLLISLVNLSISFPDSHILLEVNPLPSSHENNSTDNTDDSISSDIEVIPQIPATPTGIRYNKNGKPRKTRRPFIKMEKNYIDQRFWELKAKSPKLKDTNIAKCIYREMYCDPEEEVRDNRILIIRSQLRMQNPCMEGFNRCHESIYHRIHNLKRPNVRK